MMLDEEIRSAVTIIETLYMQLVHYIGFFNITKLVYSINF